MNVTVIGQKGDGPVRQRTVTPLEFFEGWGPFAAMLWQHARAQTLVIDDHKIRVVLVP